MAEIPEPVRRFLDTFETQQWDDLVDAYAEDAMWDASVPNWHFQWEGAERCIDQLNEWYAQHPWNVTDLNVIATAEGAALEIELRGRCPGNDEHESHLEGTRQAHFFRIEDGRIAEHRVVCAGEWLEDDLRRMDAEAPKVARKQRARA